MSIGAQSADAGRDWTTGQLAVAETLVWAGTYYFFPALILRWEQDFGWHKTELAVAFTVAVLASALAAPLAGRIIDRGRGPHLLAGSALAGGLLVALLTLVETRWQFQALWILLGLAMAGSLYEPCFAFLTRVRGGEARRAITRITLVAGFAGTVSFPTANGLAAAFGWRAAALVFAALICLVAVPLFWRAARRLERRAAPQAPVSGESDDAPVRDGLRAVLRRPTFWLLAVAFSAIALGHGSVITHLLPLLDERGVAGATAVLAASMIGPMQVAGRLGMMAIERRVSIIFICGLCFVFMLAAAGSLLLAGSLPLLLVAFVVLQGSGYGVTSIVRPVVTADLLGRSGFGAVSGALALPFMGCMALAPTLAAGIWTLGGYDAVLYALLAVLGVGFAALLLAVRAGS